MRDRCVVVGFFFYQEGKCGQWREHHAPSLMTGYTSEDCDKIGDKRGAVLRTQFGGCAFVKDE